MFLSDKYLYLTDTGPEVYCSNEKICFSLFNEANSCSLCECCPLQVEPAKLRQALKCVTLNQLFISGPIVVAIYHLMSLRGTPCGPELPTFHWALMELAFFSILEEIMFYYSHRWGSPHQIVLLTPSHRHKRSPSSFLRLFHHPNLYKRFHKQHHEWTAPIGVVATYAHPLEHVVGGHFLQGSVRTPSCHKPKHLFLSAAALQLAACGHRAGDPGLTRVHHLHVVLRGSDQHHHLPLWIPPPLPALPRVP